MSEYTNPSDKTFKKSVHKMWQDYHFSIGKTPPALPVIDKFCDNKEDADELAELVDQGIKRATASSLWSLEKTNTPIPKPGDIFLVTNWEEEAVCIVKTTEVTIKPYNKITENEALREGEGDKSLRYWKQVHQGYFERELSDFGLKFNESMPVVFQDFKKIYPLD